MCLITAQKRWRIALKNIKCYKLVHGFNSIYNNRYRYSTPYMDMLIPEEVINGRDCLYAEGKAAFEKRNVITKDSEYKPCYQIEGGAIHAFQNVSDGWDYVKAGVGNALFECIIPIGTQYAVGLNGDICAKKIRFKSRLYL